MREFGNHVEMLDLLNGWAITSNSKYVNSSIHKQKHQDFQSVDFQTLEQHAEEQQEFYY